MRIYMLQNLYDLSDMATVAEVIDSRAFSEFCGVDSSNQVPDGDTLGRFRHLLEENGIQQKLFAQVVRTRMDKGLILKKGTIVDGVSSLWAALCGVLPQRQAGKPFHRDDSCVPVDGRT